jgi:hypothetical protein
MPADWTMSSSQGTARRGPGAGQVVRAAYRLSGPDGLRRGVVYCCDGTSWRAEVSGALVWLEGPDGLYWPTGQAGLAWTAPPGSGAVVTPPLPELSALASAADAAAWAGREVPRRGRASRHAGTGRTSRTFRGVGLVVVQDIGTGLVLGLQAQLEHGAHVALDTTAFTVEHGPGPFTWDGRTQP